MLILTNNAPTNMHNVMELLFGHIINKRFHVQTSKDPGYIYSLKKRQATRQVCETTHILSELSGETVKHGQVQCS